MMAENDSTKQPTEKKGYGKRPLWQWVVLYLIIAIVVYGLVYLLFIHHSGTTSGGSSGGGY